MDDDLQPIQRRMEVGDLQVLKEFQSASKKEFRHLVLYVNLQLLDDLFVCACVCVCVVWCVVCVNGVWCGVCVCVY